MKTIAYTIRSVMMWIVLIIAALQSFRLSDIVNQNTKPRINQQQRSYQL